MTDDTFEVDTNNLIAHAYTQKPVEFQQTFAALVSDKLADAIADKKLEVAQSMFAGPDDHLDDDDDNAEIEDEMDLDDDEEDYSQEEEQDGETA
jgi:hypothetical protein